jgi:hypothetical protein
VRAARLEAIQDWTWDPTDDAWNDRLHELAGWVDASGGLPSTGSENPEERRLAMFVSSNRVTYRKGKLDALRVARLAAIPGWEWEPRAGLWGSACDETTAWMTEHGRTPSTTSQDETEARLGRFVSTNRRSRVSGTLAADRVARLAAIPGWSWNPAADAWDANLRELSEWMTDHGRTASDSKAGDPTERRLGKFANSSRGSYRKGKLTPDQVARLEAIPGWLWDPLDDAWNQNAGGLAEWMGQNGRAPSTMADDPDERRLGNFVGTCRTRYREEQMSAERFAKLEAIPGWTWNAHVDRFRTSDRELAAWMSEHGMMPPTGSKRPDVKRHGTFVATARTNYRAGRMPADQVAQLEAIPGWSWEAQTWERSRRLLASWMIGHGRVPSPSSEDDVESFLGSYARRCRSQHRKGDLDPHRVDLLESIPGWSWAPQGRSFHDTFDKFAAWVAASGRDPSSSSADPEEAKLGKFANKSRSNRRAGTLAADRVERFESIPGWSWNPPLGPHR